MDWNTLESTSQLEQIDLESQTQKILIYKHSHRCGISDSVKNQLEKDWGNDAGIKPYFLDVIKNRNISNEIATRYGISHESPQAIVLWKGKPVYNDSHFNIRFEDMVQKGEQT